jgi:hypothetical protein
MKNIYSGLVNPGSQSFEFTVPAGTYVLRLLGKSHIAIKKIIAF